MMRALPLNLRLCTAVAVAAILAPGGCTTPSSPTPPPTATPTLTTPRPTATPTPVPSPTPTPSSADLAARATSIARAHLGTPYVSFGHVDDGGQWVIWRGPLYPTLPQTETHGLNCAGYQVQLARQILSQTVPLLSVYAERDDRVDPSGDERRWYGYDQVMNLADLLGGEVFRPQEEGWLDGAGYDLSSAVAVFGQMQVGSIYFISANHAHPRWGRAHRHVATAIPTENGATIFEATHPEGVREIPPDEWLALPRWEEVEDPRFYFVAIPLPLPP